MPKFLIIRLSSIGDIIQCMGIIGGIRHQFPRAEIHWIARSDMAQTLSIDPRIDKVWSFDKKAGFSGLLQLCQQLKKERFDYIYDAHSNIRSNVIKSLLRASLCQHVKIVTRSKERLKRILLFRFGINHFDWPFIGVESFRKPLYRWGITHFDDSFNDYIFPSEITSKFKNFIGGNTITLVPSANWEMKRWPVSHWRSLIELLPEYNFVVLGGPTDSFCEDICAADSSRTINMAGESTIMESSYIVAQSKVVVSGDTGFMHSADLFKIPTIALIGPTAFGFPARESSEIFALDLMCRPCTKDGRGRCKEAIYQRCMVEITPQSVAQRVRKILPLAK
ncbi:MAG: glycosyltransferase family 9 protein [Rikenellaceae bacterium]